MSVFHFNKHDVCVDSEETEVLNEKNFQASVRLACDDDKWLAGWDWTDTIDGYEGSGSSPSRHKYITRLDTKDDAIRYVVENIIIRHLSRNMSSAKPEKARIYSEYISRCREFIADTYQLSLF